MINIIETYRALFGRGELRSGTVIDMSEHGRTGGVNTGAGFKSMGVVEDYDIHYAQQVIKDTYGDNVSVYEKKKPLLKYGRNPSLGTSRGTIWFTGQDDANETYVAANTNSIDTISSSNTNDTQAVVVEGHTETGGNKTFVVQSATLQGQGKTTLTTPLNRCTRVYNNGATNFAGNIFVYENTDLTAEKPTDTTKIHLTVNGAGGHNQSEKASTSLSSIDYWLITQVRVGVIDKTASFADVELQFRPSGGVFRQIEDLTASEGTPSVINFRPYVIVPPNADVRLQGVSDDNAGVSVSGSIQGYLAKIV